MLINLDDDKYYDYDPKRINHFRLMAWYNRFKQYKAWKKDVSKELMSVA